jgi:hypothetical protein
MVLVIRNSDFLIDSTGADETEIKQAKNLMSKNHVIFHH